MEPRNSTSDEKAPKVKFEFVNARTDVLTAMAVHPAPTPAPTPTPIFGNHVASPPTPPPGRSKKSAFQSPNPYMTPPKRIITTARMMAEKVGRELTSAEKAEFATDWKMKRFWHDKAVRERLDENEFEYELLKVADKVEAEISAKNAPVEDDRKPAAKPDSMVEDDRKPAAKPDAPVGDDAFEVDTVAPVEPEIEFVKVVEGPPDIEFVKVIEGLLDDGEVECVGVIPAPVPDEEVFPEVLVSERAVIPLGNGNATPPPSPDDVPYFYPPEGVHLPRQFVKWYCRLNYIRNRIDMFKRNPRNFYPHTIRMNRRGSEKYSRLATAAGVTRSKMYDFVRLFASTNIRTDARDVVISIMYAMMAEFPTLI